MIAYPLANTGWEKNYLGMLGFAPEQLVDTRTCRLAVAAGGVIHAASGEDAGFFKRGAHPADYEAARHALWKGPSNGRPPSRRLYLQRQGRRRILNESDLLKALAPYGFETIDLNDYPLSEQIQMLADASVILGAHGANLSSMVWCPPGAAVIAFYNRGFRPTFDQQMAFGLSLDFHYWIEKPLVPHHFSNLNLDITVDIPVLEKFLKTTLS